MRILAIALLLTLSSCTSVQGVIDNKEIYCSQFYKGIRAVCLMSVTLLMRSLRRKTPTA
jgi:uncharacterized protein YceK